MLLEDENSKQIKINEENDVATHKSQLWYSEKLFTPTLRRESLPIPCQNYPQEKILVYLQEYAFSSRFYFLARRLSSTYGILSSAFWFWYLPASSSHQTHVPSHIIYNLYVAIAVTPLQPADETRWKIINHAEIKLRNLSAICFLFPCILLILVTITLFVW